MKKLFFHIGLSKTGSTYLQNRFFDKLNGIKYIHTSKFYLYPEIIKKEKECNLLFSREFDRQYEDEVQKIADKYPDAFIIIVLRSNEQWIASQYRRYVKNGGSKLPDEFINIKDDSGVWKIRDAEFMSKLEFLKDKFKNKPLVLFYNELKKDPHAFFGKIAAYTDSEYISEEINLNPKHKSYSEKQLLFVRNLTKRLYKKEPEEFTKGNVSWLKFRTRWLILHFALYLAKILPLKYDKGLINSNLINNYKEFYKSDWEKCLNFAEEFSAK